MEDVSDDDMLSDMRADAEERDYRDGKARDALLEQIEGLEKQLGLRKDALAEVAALEERFSDDPDNETLRRELHQARVKSGWSEFKINTTSGLEARSVIPWVATRDVTWSEEWSTASGPTPTSSWLRPEKKVLDGGRLMQIGNHRTCDDGKWRRDVTQEFDVVAVEDLAHLCSIVTRMEDVIVYKPDATGLMKITIFDDNGQS